MNGFFRFFKYPVLGSLVYPLGSVGTHGYPRAIQLKPTQQKPQTNCTSQTKANANNATMTTPPSPTSSDEDSIELVWQDDAGADLRSLFAKDMMSMTQQIDGWGSDESDDDEDGGGEDGSETDDIDG